MVRCDSRISLKENKFVPQLKPPQPKKENCQKGFLQNRLSKNRAVPPPDPTLKNLKQIYKKKNILTDRLTRVCAREATASKKEKG